MRPAFRVSVFAVALGAVGIVASAQSAEAQQQLRYPESSTSYRKRMDDVVKTLRARCNTICPAADRPRIMAALDKVLSRVMDVCADGVVTSDENDWVMATVPSPAPPRPRPNP